MSESMTSKGGAGGPGATRWTPPLNERRARFVYEAARMAAQAALAPVVPEPWDLRDHAFREQFLEVIERQCGPDRISDPSALHDDWVKAYEKMGWTWGPERDQARKTHPDMVPYNELGQLERDKDAVFVVLCEIARGWIYDQPTERVMSGLPESQWADEQASAE